MNKRVYGVIGVGAYNSNWNADFDKGPKRLPDSRITASDKALKYAMRDYWDQNGAKVLMKRSYAIKTIEGAKKTAPKEVATSRTLEERYDYITNSCIKDETDDGVILSNIMSCVDVRQFGVAFAVTAHNYSITGPVQITQGLNTYDYTLPYIQTILSPFKNSNSKSSEEGNEENTASEETENNEKKKEDKSQTATTLGTMTLVDEAHYAYGFSINPRQARPYDHIRGDMEDVMKYTEEDYAQFIEAARVAATALDTCSKTGAENEYLIVIEGHENGKLYLANLAEYVHVDKLDGVKRVLDLTKLIGYLELQAKNISKIDIYTNSMRIDVNIPETTLNITIKNIFED